MIHELRITGLGVIEEAVCRFAPGLTAVTGETGAGKTMVVTGLGLLGGARADAGLVRAGCAQASAEGWFELEADDPVAAIVRDAGGLVDEEGLTAARIIASRARSVLGGRGVPTALMGQVVGQLLAIHGQHEQTRVGARALELLDAYAGPPAQHERAEVAAAFARVRSAEAELSELRTGAMARARELDMLTFSLEEIAAVDPQPGEDAALAAEAERLAHADALVTAARAARQAVVADDDPDLAADAMTLLASARRALESAVGHDPALGEPAAAIGSVMVQLAEVAADLASYAEDVDSDPRRLAVVQERQAALAKLTRKYGADVDEVLAWSAEAAARVARLSSADDRIEALSAQVAGLRTELAVAAGRLRGLRLAAAGLFAEQVGRELAALAMPRARVAFEVATVPDAAGLVVPGIDGPVAVRATGIDDVTLMLAANPGAPPRPISQAASGGELSRVMLAIQVVLAGADPVPTMVFDEVDAGVGGAAAIELGRRLQRLGASTQVIVVTHLAQVAAFADRHLVVTKDSEGSVTVSSVQAVEGEPRVRELARMMAGIADSGAAAAHVAELLDLARREAADASR